MMVAPALFVLLGCLGAALWGLGTLALGAVRRRRATAVRGIALLCLASGVGAYAWGVVLVGVTHSEAVEGAGSSPAHICQDAGQGAVSGHRRGYVPPWFDCVRQDGSTFSAGLVPRWLTPMAVVLSVAGTWLIVTTPERSRVRD